MRQMLADFWCLDMFNLYELLSGLFSSFCKALGLLDDIQSSRLQSQDTSKICIENLRRKLNLNRRHLRQCRVTPAFGLEWSERRIRHFQGLVVLKQNLQLRKKDLNKNLASTPTLEEFYSMNRLESLKPWIRKLHWVAGLWEIQWPSRTKQGTLQIDRERLNLQSGTW